MFAELESPSSGIAARIAGKLFSIAASELLQNELRKFKQLVETGEIAVSAATTEAGPHEACRRATSRTHSPEIDHIRANYTQEKS